MPNPTHRGQGNERHSTDVSDRVISRGQTAPYDINGAPTGAALADGDYGDIVVSGSGSVMEFDPAVVTAYARTLLAAADAAAARAVLAAQEAHALLSALAGMGASTGLVEQTGATAFAKRAIGTAAATDILTRGDGDGRYALTAHTHVIADVTGLQAALDAKLDSASYTAADVLAKLLTVDGAGSGLDADTLDGMSSGAFAAAAHTHIIADVTGLQAALDGKQPLDADLTTWAGITPAAGIGTFLATPSSANLRAAMTDETGTGNLVFSASPTFTGTLTAAAATFSGAITATTAGIVTNSIFVQGSSPEATLKDTDTAGNAATMFFAGRDSANAVQWRIGRPFTTVLRFENLGGSFGWYNALGAGQMMLLDATGLDVVGKVQCDSLRIDIAAVAGAVAATHTVAVNINGVAGRILLAIP